MSEQLIQKLRIPEMTGGIQANFCKNPTCKNFGVPASQQSQIGRRADNKGAFDSYTLTAKKTEAGVIIPRLQCDLCGEKPPIKSNKAIFEELTRISDYVNVSPQTVSCPNNDCSNHSNDIMMYPKNYQAFGKTRSGSQRYRCKLCMTTFAVGRATTGQKKPHKNSLVFRLLMNKMPFKRICETADITMPTLYWKIGFLHRQCIEFAAERERKLIEGMPIKRLYIGVDRQDYVVNWLNTVDKRNVVLNAVGSADNGTGYVFGLHLNFDPSPNPFEIETDAEACGDYTIKIPFRKYARLWLSKDYQDALRRSYLNRHTETYGTLLEEIRETYREASGRDNIEESETETYSTKLPARGMKVHAEYTLYGHFFFLRNLFNGVEKVRFFLDQDSGMRAACLGAFSDYIRAARCDAFYVRINKELTIDQRRKTMASAKREWEETKKIHPDLTDSKLKLLLIKERMKEVMHMGKWQDKWIYHPFPSMAEPEKALCYLTDIQGYDEDHLAWLYNKASLHAIDRFFMQVRRRVSLLERGISTSSNTGRRWHGYSAYNPAIIIKMLDIFRVFYNYIEVGKDGHTPAMRLGLAKTAKRIEDIIYY